MTRGILLNNPFDIRISNTQWRGKVIPSEDKDFETFDTSWHGIRAGLKNLYNYQTLHKLDTIREIITRYAPASENDTTAYIEAVSTRMKCDPDATLDLNDPQTLYALGIAVIEQEQGRNPYSPALILDEVDNVLNISN